MKFFIGAPPGAESIPTEAAPRSTRKPLMGHSNLDHLKAALIGRQHQVPLPPTMRIQLADMFMQELNGKFECLPLLAEQHGSATLAEAMYLQGAIMKGTFIDHEVQSPSRLLAALSSLPSEAVWLSYVDVIE